MKGSFVLSKFLTDNTANLITTLRFISSVWLIIETATQIRIDPLALHLFNFSAICDALDGYVARAMKITSKFGAFYDRMVDKLFVCPMLSVLIYRWRNIDENLLLNDFVITLVAVLIILELCLFVSGSVALIRGWVVQSNKFGKWKMIIECVLIWFWLYGLYFVPAEEWFYYVLCIISGLLLISIYLAMRSLDTYLTSYNNN
jgi:CDP-diacylglycerol--glycerol-3-phosphate 3-phosphatidyltransferase